MSTLKKSLALCLAVCILLSFLLGVAFVGAHAGHDCNDPDCLICACLHHLQSASRLLGALAVAFAAFAVLAVGSWLAVPNAKAQKNSLIAQKVQLNL